MYTYSSLTLLYNAVKRQCVLIASVVSDSLWPHGLYSPPGSSVCGILQARILEWVAMPFSKVKKKKNGLASNRDSQLLLHIKITWRTEQYWCQSPRPKIPSQLLWVGTLALFIAFLFFSAAQVENHWPSHTRIRCHVKPGDSSSEHWLWRQGNPNDRPGCLLPFQL